MVTSKIMTFITTEYRFNGVPDSNGYLATELPLSGYVPIGVLNPSRDGWQYEFVSYRSKDNKNWTMRIVSTNTPTGTFEGRIIAIRLMGEVIQNLLAEAVQASGGRHDRLTYFRRKNDNVGIHSNKSNHILVQSPAVWKLDGLYRCVFLSVWCGDGSKTNRCTENKQRTIRFKQYTNKQRTDRDHTKWGYSNCNDCSSNVFPRACDSVLLTVEEVA